MSTQKSTQEYLQQLHSLQPKLEKNQIYVTWWMDKERCYIWYRRILISYKKEYNTSSGYNMNEPWNNYVKWKKPDTKRYMLYDSTYFKCLEYLIPQRQSISSFQGRGKGMEGSVY